MVTKALTARERPTAIDLFCGAGGMSLGFEQAGFDILLGVDRDGHHVAVHHRNFPHGKTLCASLADLHAGDLFDAIGARPEIDLVFGGPPCQGFSHMGLRDAHDPRNTLVDHFARIVAEIQPRAFVMENVPGMRSGATKAVLDRATGLLQGVGYRIAEPVRVLDAGDFGVPQKRKRLFLLGVRSDIASDFHYPDGPCAGRPARPTVGEALADLPVVEDDVELFAVDRTAYDRPPKTRYAQVARGMLEDPSDFSHPRAWRDGICTGCLRVKHTPRAAGLYAATPPGQMVPGHKLPRLDPLGIAPTLRAGSDSAHGSYTAPRPIHPWLPRCITAREAARLHGFPDWFAFYPLKWHAYRQIGNAVCPPVARAVGREAMRALGYEPRKPVEAVRLADTFSLPDDRPRTLRRIPHLDHYPRVVAYLFERSYDETTNRLWRQRFAFEDVLEAIRATGAELPWTRADTFVQEIGRSRNVRQILDACLAKGYSLRAVRDGRFIGEFVPAGESGAVEDKESIQVRSQDVASALSLALAHPFSLQDAAALPALFAEPLVVASMWPGQKVRIEIAIATERGDGGFTAEYRLKNRNRPAGRGCLIVSVAGNLPSRARIGRLAQTARVDEILVMAAITNKHVLISRFEECRAVPREACKNVFEVANAAARIASQEDPA